MILAFCNCLNIKINTSEIKPISDEYGKLKNSFRAANNSDCFEFFKTALGTFKELNIFVAEPTLIQNVIVNKWTIQRCMSCDSFVYAYTRAGEYLLNGNLVRDEKKLFEMESCDNFSMPFKIILRQVDSFGTAGNGIGNDPRIKQLHEKLEDYISNETAKTEREIQLFTEQKLTELNNKRERAAKDYAMLANIVKSLSLQQLVTIDCNNSTNLDSLNITTNDDTISTTDMTDATAVSSTSDNNTIVDTPPTTPDSTTPMSLDISPSSSTNMKPEIPQNSSSHRKIMKDLSAKHSNLLQSQLQHTMKPIDFDEMFDMDGMIITQHAPPTNVTNGHPIHINSHKGQSVKFADVDYYPSDDEPVVVDKRSGPLKIPRSGKQSAAMLAKSAPIEIMGPLRYEIDLEDEPENNIDIAASIKALAKSVHGDAVFGDLPTRPRFSTQI